MNAEHGLDPLTGDKKAEVPKEEMAPEERARRTAKNKRRYERRKAKRKGVRGQV